MLALSFPQDVWTILLGIGLAASVATTVAMILGRTPSKKPTVQLDSPASAPAWVPVPTANAARERAAASARAKAAASVRDRGIQLTDVRELVSAGEDPGGQGDIRVDDHGEQQPSAVTPEEAQVIFTHAAEHEPNRVAEVISEWIRADLKNMARRPR